MPVKSIIKRANAFDARSAREARKYLEKLELELRRRISGNIGTKWDLQHYNNLRREVVELLAEIEPVLTGRLREKILQAGEIGKELALSVARGISLRPFAQPVLTLPFVTEAANASATHIKDVTESLRRKIDIQVNNGIQGLKAGVEVIQSIADVKGFTGIAFKSVAQRAEDIFRTETSRVINMATVAHYKSLDENTAEELLKYWLATADSRTRQEHYAIWRKTDPNVGGTPIPFADDFELSDGDSGFAPSAPSLSAKNVINCRCRMLIISKKEYLRKFKR